jgi:hypothetical protein
VPETAQPLTAINPDGTWQCDITMDGIDEQATEIVAFVVPNDYNPPLMRGQTSLPRELSRESVAADGAQRGPSP